MSDFDGSTILITGGGSGIGLATARALAGDGANVVLAGRDPQRLATAAQSLDAGDRVLTVPTDVSRVDDLNGLIEQIQTRFGKLHGVFANAGIAVFQRGADVTEADFDRLVDINFKGVFFTVQKSLPVLADGASIVLNGSWLTHRGMAFTSVYGATKAAVVHLARSLAADLAPRGIRINTISPGYVFTDMFTSISTTEQEWETLRGHVAAGRLGQPEDIAEAAKFLLSPRSSYITGQELLVDGGLINTIPL